MLASLLYPYDDDAKDHIDAWLDQLTSEGCIARYQVDGTDYVQILHWAEHQKIDRPSPSKLPAFVEQSRSLAKDREPSPLDPDLGREGKGSGPEDGAPPQSDGPPVLTLTLNDKTEHPVYAAQIEEWGKAFPAVNVEQQLREMRVWCTANPANRKTARGVNAFIVRWLGREQDKGARPGRPDVVGVTVPGAAGPDPALVKLREHKGAPIPEGVRKKIGELRRAA